MASRTLQASKPEPQVAPATVTTILILREPDGHKAIDISSPEQHQTVALAIVKARFDADYYTEPVEPIRPEFTYDQVRKLPEGQFRNFGLGVWQRYKEDVAKWRIRREAWELINTCVDTDDGIAAVRILSSRREFEGEDFQVLEVQPSYF